MPTTTPRRRGRPLKEDIPLSPPERSRRWREQRKRAGKIRLDIWLPVKIAERIKQEAAKSKCSLGAIVAAHLQRSRDGPRYKEANDKARAMLNPLRGTGVRADTLEAVIEVLLKPIFTNPRSNPRAAKPATANRRVPEPGWDEPELDGN